MKPTLLALSAGLTLPIAAVNAAEIDVMAVYTDNVASSNGGASGVRAAINAAIASSNRAFSNSNVDTRLRLVHTEQVSYDESTPGNDLNALRLTNDGKMDEIHRIRNEKGADLVALIADSAQWGNTAGIGYVLGGRSASYGFSATGFRFTSTGNTFAHEIGHNLGCGHDEQNGNGTFDDSNGWRFTGDSGRLHRTVMAYSPGRRTDYFSNPDVFFDGKATGVAGQADNVRTIEQTQDGTANYRPTRVTSGGGGSTPPQPPTPPKPEPIDSRIAKIFPEATGNAQSVTTWFGKLEDISFPNVNHQFLGTVRLWDRSSADRFYFNDPALGGWVYTRKGTYPNMYRTSDRTWLRYNVGSRNPRTFYNYKTGRTERL